MAVASPGGGTPKAWSMEQDRRAQQYTTKWDEVPVVRAWLEEVARTMDLPETLVRLRIN